MGKPSLENTPIWFTWRVEIQIVSGFKAGRRRLDSISLLFVFLVDGHVFRVYFAWARHGW